GGPWPAQLRTCVTIRSIRCDLPLGGHRSVAFSHAFYNPLISNRIRRFRSAFGVAVRRSAVRFLTRGTGGQARMAAGSRGPEARSYTAVLPNGVEPRNRTAGVLARYGPGDSA